MKDVIKVSHKMRQNIVSCPAYPHHCMSSVVGQSTDVRIAFAMDAISNDSCSTVLRDELGKIDAST